jgi:sugar/nucleoside kinase (ribokinase family)
LRHDVVVGDAHELKQITGAVELEDAISRVRNRMRGENLRAAAISIGSEGALAFTLDSRWDAPAFHVNVVDTTGAGDAFAAAIAYGFACRWDWGEAIRFANAVAACATTALGAQSALPTWDAATSLMHSSNLDKT